jgi:glycosyltransferase involved in cell wall biosynthesis
MEESQRYGFQEHGNWSMNWLMEMEDKEFGDADGIIVASNAAKQSMIDNDVAEKKIFVNNLGVDCEVFTPGVKRDDVFRVVQCSSVTPRKGIHHLLRAFAELNLPESELWFIGGGLTGAARDKEFSGFIKRYARTNILFRGSVRQRDLIPIYQQASVAVLLSVADGFGMVVPQAMACGLPVIVSSKTGAADLVKPGHNGYVIPSGDIEMLKTHLLTLYEQPERRRSMGVLARQTIAEGFTWTHYGERLVRYLRSL